jgi:hypothetical protein
MRETKGTSPTLDKRQTVDGFTTLDKRQMIVDAMERNGLKEEKSCTTG